MSTRGAVRLVSFAIGGWLTWWIWAGPHIALPWNGAPLELALWVLWALLDSRIDRFCELVHRVKHRDENSPSVRGFLKRDAIP